MDITLRPIAPEEFAAFELADSYGFGYRLAPEETHQVWASAELDRAIGAFEGDEVVGTGRNYSLELTLPGGAIVPAGGVSWISSRPTHRRRGILTKMMAALVDDSVARGEPVSILTASEGAIYGRFGYGVATRSLGIRMLKAHTSFRDPAPRGRIRMIEEDEARKIGPEVFDRVRKTRPGAVSRLDEWWPEVWAPKEWVKHRFDAVYEVDGRVEGFVVYGVDGDWGEGFSEKTVQVRDLAAVSPEAEAALWRFLCSIDLIQWVSAFRVPTDIELPWLLTDMRQVRTTSFTDWLWLRPLDTAALLSERRYAVEAAVVIEVHDPTRPDGAAAGRFLVDGGQDGAACSRTRKRADLTLDVAALGAISLGGLEPTRLVRAGLIEEHRAGAAAMATSMFAAERDPFSFTWF